jgi:hypothetical protein
MSFNKEPKDLDLINEKEFFEGVCHYILDKPTLRQPFIGNTPMSGTYTLQMFPLGYSKYESLGFALRWDNDKGKLLFYKYGCSLMWTRLRANFVNQFSNDNS